MEKVEKLIKIAASSMAVIVPSILLAGYSYHLGYIMTFGLSSDLIPKTMSDVLAESWYIGVIAMGWLLSKWLYFISVFLLLLILLIIGFFWVRRQKEKGNLWIFQEVTKESHGKELFGITQWQWVILGEAFRDLFSWIAYPFFIIAIIALFTGFPYIDARNYALDQLDLFKEKGCESNDNKISCVYLIDTEKQQNNILAKGILVSANEQRVAIYNKKLEIWPVLDNYIIQQKDVAKIAKVKPKE